MGLSLFRLSVVCSFFFSFRNIILTYKTTKFDILKTCPASVSSLEQCLKKGGRYTFTQESVGIVWLVFADKGELCFPHQINATKLSCTTCRFSKHTLLGKFHTFDLYCEKSASLEKPFVYVNLVYHCWRSNQFVASAAFLNFAVWKKVSLFSNYLLVMSW